MNDSNKKTQRSFQCREALWQKFEHMAHELECSVDYLINDAMKQYARQRGYANTSTSSNHMAVPPSSVHGAPPPPPPPPPTHSSSPAFAATLAVPRPTPAPAPPVPAVAPPAPPPPPAMPSPTVQRGSAASMAVPTAPTLVAPTSPTLIRRPPTPPPPNRLTTAAAAPPVPATGPAPTSGLKIYYQGEAFAVTKDRFIIGRGKQTSDLTIKDPNVSRQHAMVEFSGGHYYMVDLGSTNGIEFNGQRVQRKMIQDGDVFRICDYELRIAFH
jgi:neural Wiskott-Aldrich syndrome protein